MKPLEKNIKIDQALSNISVKYENDDYIAEDVLPVVRVSESSGKYYKYDKSHLRAEEDRRGIGSGTHETEYGMASQGSFQTTEHALKELVPDEIQEQADNALNPRIDATQSVTDKLRVGQEKRLATYMADTGNLGNNTTLSGDSQWSDYANSDPISDVKTAKQSVHSNSIKKANTMVLGKQVYDYLLDHPDILDRIKYSQTGIANSGLLARVFDVDNILVGRAMENDADEGASDSLSYIWGKHAWLLHVEDSPGLRSVTFGYYIKNQDRVVDRWYEQDRKGTFIRVTDKYDRAIVTTDASYLVKDAVA